jgi:REP element-mobilizing transposase RayT
MQRKEHYHGSLPHYQQPGQWYFITCVLNDSFHSKALRRNAHKINLARAIYEQLKKTNPAGEDCTKAKKAYLHERRHYSIVFDKHLNNISIPKINLSLEYNRKILEEALGYWEGKRLTSHAWCIMPSHFHWVVSLFKTDERGTPVFLQDILHSVKLYSARRINKAENRSGQLWMHESFETTIRDDRHFMNVVNYTINNPVVARLVNDYREWPGTFIKSGLF